MEIKEYQNDILEIIDYNIILKEPNDFFDIFFGNNCSTIILKKENIISDFYDLSTGIAGEILQKISNYRKRMAVIGDFENIKNKILKDFIYESNKAGEIIFVKTVEEAIKIFGSSGIMVEGYMSRKYLKCPIFPFHILLLEEMIPKRHI